MAVEQFKIVPQVVFCKSSTFCWSSSGLVHSEPNCNKLSKYTIGRKVTSWGFFRLVLLPSYLTVPRKLWTVEIKHFGPVFSVHCPVVASALNSTRAERELIVLNYRLLIYKCETATVTTVRPKRTKLVHSDQFCRHLIMAEMTVTSVSCPLFKLISNKRTKLDCSRVQDALFFLQIVSLIHTVVIIVWTRMPEYKRFQFLF